MNISEHRAGKAYAIDAMLHAVTALNSGNTPVSFQRNGAFYALFPNGFGKYTPGLHLAYRQCIERDRFRTIHENAPETLASQDAIVKSTDENEKTVFIKGEKDKFAPLIFNRDSDGAFSLKSMQILEQQLKELGDDGKIRMVTHSQSYHSNKYGYAADGTDTWLGEARVMPFDNYLEIIRDREDLFHQTIRSKADNDQIRGTLYGSCTHPAGGKIVNIPEVMIMTPELMFTFPRAGQLDSHNRLQAWTDTEGLGSNWQSPYYPEISMREGKLFSHYIMLNAQRHKVPSFGLDELAESISGNLMKTFKAMNQDIAPIVHYIDRINTTYIIGIARAEEERDEIRQARREKQLK